MRLFQFLACLCLFLTKGSACVYAGISYGDTEPATVSVSHASLHRISQDRQAVALAADLRLDGRPECIFLEDDLEDDEDASSNDSAPLHRAPAGLHAAASYPSRHLILKQAAAGFKPIVPLPGLPPEKRIFQGVFRI